MGWTQRALVLVALSTLCGLAAVSAALVVIRVPLPSRAEAFQQYPTAWGFADDALGQLSALAIQSCAAERGSAAEGTEGVVFKAQQQTIDQRYFALAKDYDRRVRHVVASGERRPRDVPAGAPPLSVAKSRVCLKPGEVPPPTPILPENFVHASNVLTELELEQAALAAGWPLGPGWWDDMRRIVYCESGRNTLAHNKSDPNGGSYGLSQLNGTQHFTKSGEDFEMRYDPIVNLRTALWLRTVRGHFGGGGGWSCADKLGIR
jgi:hypothetical protein